MTGFSYLEEKNYPKEDIIDPDEDFSDIDKNIKFKKANIHMYKCQDNNNNKNLNFTENNNSDNHENGDYISDLIDDEDIYSNNNEEDDGDNDNDLVDTSNLNKTELYMKSKS